MSKRKALKERFANGVLNSYQSFKSMGKSIMEQNAGIVIGCDLCDDYTQVYLFNWKTYEAEPVCMDYEENKSMIPTVLFQKKSNREWLFAREAEECKEEGIRFKNFVYKLGSQDYFECVESKRTPAELLAIYFRKILSLARGEYPKDEIRKLIITMDKPERTVIDLIYKALLSLGMEAERVGIRSHKQCFVYYTLNQEKELLYHDVGLFDLGVEHLHFCRLHVDRKFLPALVRVDSKDLTKELMEGEILKDFGRVAGKELHGQNVSTVYMVGSSFHNDWIRAGLEEVSRGRRIFIGQNLYAKGACYYARESVKAGNLGEYEIVSDEMTSYQILIDAYYDARQQKKMVIASGIPWYDAKAEFDILLDHEDGICFHAEDRHGRRHGSFRMTFHELESRPGRMTRMRMKLFFIEKDVLVIQARDRGFGNVYPGTGRIFEETVKV